MTTSRTLATYGVIAGLMTKSAEINVLALVAGYLDHLEAKRNQEAVQAAQMICQERMMQGVYANDANAMARDLEYETELQKILYKK